MLLSVVGATTRGELGKSGCCCPHLPSPHLQGLSNTGEGWDVEHNPTIQKGKLSLRGAGLVKVETRGGRVRRTCKVFPLPCSLWQMEQWLSPDRTGEEDISASSRGGMEGLRKMVLVVSSLRMDEG